MPASKKFIDLKQLARDAATPAHINARPPTTNAHGGGPGCAPGPAPGRGRTARAKSPW